MDQLKIFIPLIRFFHTVAMLALLKIRVFEIKTTENFNTLKILTFH